MESDWKMEYNSEREELTIPEYGRHIQKLIDYARTIEDPKLRQAFAERIVDLMMQMNPQNRTLEDYREKLWKHLFRMAHFQLDVTPPEGVSSRPEDAQLRPDIIEYPVYEARFRHYGHNVQRLIQMAIAMEDGPKKEGLVDAIASYMKLAYKTWNKDHYVSDEVIKGDLEALSEGKLVLHEDSAIENLDKNQPRRPSNKRQSNQGGKDKRYRRKRK